MCKIDKNDIIFIDNSSPIKSMLQTQTINPKLLVEYRCHECNKLLCKGFLTGKENVLEVKCRGCGRMCLFYGEDAEIVKQRSVLIKQGLIPDTDPD